MSQDLADTWSPGIEYILEEIRLNSITISEHHKQKYYDAKGYLKYFRIPTIVFSAMNSVFSVGLQPYCPQQFISLICCVISLVCGVISSVELFLSIQSTMENELISSKDFYLLSVDIFKILSLERGTRMVNGKVYLDETYQTYCKLIENSNIVSAEMRNMIKPNTFTPKLLNDTKKEVGNELQAIISKNEENKKVEIEKENMMISELEENNKQEEKEDLEQEEEEEEKENYKDENQQKSTDCNNNQIIETIIKISPTIEDEAVNKIKRKYTKKKGIPNL
jgi:hypothetical protein